MDDSNLLVQCDFEVYGHVQGRVNFNSIVATNINQICYFSGVGFTKFCRDNCLNAGIRGWVKNSKKGTIVGKMQGLKPEVDKM